jgi:AcrR family transcriptional regulator
VPKLWTESVETHRRLVRDTAIDATAALVREHGVRAVTMSQIAQQTGIGRATLYKYFADVETILAAWHEREISGHVEELERLREGSAGPLQTLKAVLERYALIQFDHDDAEAVSQLHRGEHVARAQQHLREFIAALIADAAAAGAVRRDVPAAELANYAVHALGAARTVSSKAAVQRLVGVTMRSLHDNADPVSRDAQ